MTNYNNYTVSIHYDRRLYRHDIAGSIAHARMLGKQGIISEEDAGLIVDGLGSSSRMRKALTLDSVPTPPTNCGAFLRATHWRS